LEPLQSITGVPLENPSGLDPLQLIADAGPISLAVLIILAIFSFVSWAIIFSKWIVFRQAESQSRAFLEVFRRSKKFSEVRTVCRQLRASPLVGMFLAGYNELDYQLRAREAKGGSVAGEEVDEEPSQIKSLESVARSLVRSSNIEVLKLERRLSFLARPGARLLSSVCLGLCGES
jgi:biopolymer transport protein TolQ